jgi:protein gp37
MQAMHNPRYLNGFNVTLHPDLIDLPRHWAKPRTIFVNSMSELFHKDIPLEFNQSVFKTMNECPQHTFQILPKRSDVLGQRASHLTWTDNIWMGVSVENDT